MKWTRNNKKGFLLAEDEQDQLAMLSELPGGSKPWQGHKGCVQKGQLSFHSYVRTKEKDINSNWWETELWGNWQIPGGTS